MNSQIARRSHSGSKLTNTWKMRHIMKVVIWALAMVPFTIATWNNGHHQSYSALGRWSSKAQRTTTKSSSLPSLLEDNQMKNRQRNFGSELRAGAMAPAAPSAAILRTSLSYYLRVALAGGVAGATGTAVLYPMDSAKTLRQSNPTMYSSVRHAFMKLIKSSNSWHISRAYRGIVPAALGAVPSSALYFGAYESSKLALSEIFLKDNKSSTTQQRLLVHGLAAACGNTISSAVFVPKEVIKQQLQCATNGAASVGAVLVNVLQERGVRGLYAGYQATLMRNIPSAMLRFVLYEEFKHKWASSSSQTSTSDKAPFLPSSVRVFAAGAVAGAMSSGLMTPVDVLKTRLATGTCPLGVGNCFLHIVKETGWRGLYAGAGSRMMWSGAFSAIGFGTFELVKQSLGVSDITMTGKRKHAKKPELATIPRT